MKNKYLLFIVAFVLWSCASSNYLISYRYKKIREIVIIKLPHELYTAVPIISEEEFDSEDFPKDMNRIVIDTFTLNLGIEEFQTNHIDIRTKVIIYFTKGEKRVLLMDQFGRTLYNNKIYSGSIEALAFLRGEDLEIIPSE